MAKEKTYLRQAAERVAGHARTALGQAWKFDFISLITLLMPLIQQLLTNCQNKPKPPAPSAIQRNCDKEESRTLTTIAAAVRKRFPEATFQEKRALRQALRECCAGCTCDEMGALMAECKA